MLIRSVCFRSIKIYLAQTFADLMLEWSKSPSLARFTYDPEPTEARAAAFELLRLSETISHDAVCNACIAASNVQPNDDAFCSAMEYLTFTVGYIDSGNDRAPAMRSLSAVLADSGMDSACKLKLLQVLHNMPNDKVETSAVCEAVHGCLLDSCAKVCTLTANVLEPLCSHSTTPASAACRARINRYLLAWLVNDTDKRLAVIAAAGSIKFIDDVVVEVLVALLENSDTAVRVATLKTLTDLHVSSANAISVSQRFLHASTPSLRDAATEFLFSAVSLAALNADVSVINEESVSAALMYLKEGSVAYLRDKALDMLRDVCILQIADAESSTHHADRFQLKDCLRSYLDGGAARETLAVQEKAWDFWASCFALEPEDMEFLHQCFKKSRGGTVTRRAVAAIMQQIVLRTTADCNNGLEMSGAHPWMLNYLFCKCLVVNLIAC